MKKPFVVSVLAGFLLQSLVVYSVKASDDEEYIPEVVGVKASHEGYHGGSLVVRKRVDAWVESSTGTGGPSLDVGRLAGKLDKIGSDSTTTLQDVEEVRADSKKLDDRLSSIPEARSLGTSVVLPHSFSSFSPWVSDTLFLPKDMVDRFDHRRWAINLSPSVNNGNARSGVEGYTATDLADNLNIGAWNCAAGHIETSGHRYAGAGGCCQGYVRVARQELLGLVAFASRHSRTHRAYVSEFERFERQVNLLDTQVRSYAASHGYVVPSIAAYATQRPVDRYRHIHGPAQTFSDWLKWLSPASNTGVILDFTDVDDLGIMSQKVFVQGRNAACGHTAAGNSYTDYNWCCGHHYTRSMKIDMFQVALDLLMNQRYHEEYVRQAAVFEDFARRTISTYWTGWSGVPTSLVMASGGLGTVVSTPSGPVLTASEPSDAPYQALKTDRERLRGGLTRAIATLRSAEECTEISKGVLEIGKHCGNMTGIGFGVATLQQELENALRGVDELTVDNKKLRKEVDGIREAERIRAKAEEKAQWEARDKDQSDRIARMEADAAKIKEEARERERTIELRMERMIQENTAAGLQREADFRKALDDAAKIKEAESRRMIGMTSLATTLGQVLHELNMQKTPDDLYAFGTLTEDGLSPFAPGMTDILVKTKIFAKIQRVIMERRPAFASAFSDPA